MTLSNIHTAMIGGVLGLFTGLHIAFYSIDPPHTCRDFTDGQPGVSRE